MSSPLIPSSKLQSPSSHISPSPNCPLPPPMADSNQPEPPTNGAATLPTETLPSISTAVGSKRQRRPSVRLGAIGEQPASVIPHESYIRRCKQLNVPVPSHYLNYPYGKDSKFSSKTRPLTNLVSEDHHETAEASPGDDNFEFRRGGWDGKVKRGGMMTTGVRRVRSNWGKGDGDLKSSGGDNVGDEGNSRELDDFRREDSVSPVKEHSQSDERLAADAEDRDWISGKRRRLLENGGVRAWLDGLGLERYAPVFEIHEVDDEVLPLLTLEDLKDMGINAVGSRRKMYSAIQRLGKRSR